MNSHLPNKPTEYNKQYDSKIIFDKVGINPIRTISRQILFVYLSIAGYPLLISLNIPTLSNGRVVEICHNIGIILTPRIYIVRIISSLIARIVDVV
jgi:hypothetical protein